MLVIMFGAVSYTYYTASKNVNLTCPSTNVTTICPQPKVNFQCPSINYKCQTCPNITCAQCYSVVKTYTSHLQEVASSVSIERPYSYTDNTWNCDDMSKELVNRYNNAGYNCYMQCGWYYTNETNLNEKYRHCWVICNNIIIESTTGKIISSAYYWQYKNY
jgi:hypothetical protein